MNELKKITKKEWDLMYDTNMNADYVLTADAIW